MRERSGWEVTRLAGSQLEDNHGLVEDELRRSLRVERAQGEDAALTKNKVLQVGVLCGEGTCCKVDGLSGERAVGEVRVAEVTSDFESVLRQLIQHGKTREKIFECT